MNNIRTPIGTQCRNMHVKMLEERSSLGGSSNLISMISMRSYLQNILIGILLTIIKKK